MMNEPISIGVNLQSATMMYYPFVHPPRLVVWQALLYWDELTSISPEDGYQFGRDLMELRDLGLYRPSHADELPARARAALISDLFQVVERTPGEKLVPVPGPLAPDNHLYWGKLPYMVEQDLVELGALIPQDGMLRASPTLLAQLMIVLAKHLAAATQGTIPFTESRAASGIAFAPLGPNLGHRSCWQMQIGRLLPVPAPNTSLAKVLQFRDAYADERQELSRAIRKLLLLVRKNDKDVDPVAVREQIETSVERLERAGRSNGILWLKRSLWVLAGIDAAGIGTLVPHYSWVFDTLGSLSISIATVVTRPGVSTEFSYLQNLRATFPDAAWPAAPATQ